MADFEIVLTEPPALTVTVVEEPNPRVDVVVTPTAPEVVEVRVPGPQGEPGSKGDKGDPGSVAPGSGDLNYVHQQSQPSGLWTITHALGKRPAVSVFDSAGTQVEGDVKHLDSSTMTLEFAYPFSGTAILN